MARQARKRAPGTGRDQSRKAAGRRTTGSKPARDRLREAALRLLAERGWAATTVADIAAEAGVSAAEAAEIFPTKAAILAEVQTWIDEQAGAAAPGSGTVRDKLFELLMRRFDALKPHKKAVRALAAGVCANPLAGLTAAPRLAKSLARSLDSAGAGTSGPTGPLKVQGLGLIYANAFRIWLGDETPDMSKTMAALDRGLGRAESLARLCPQRGHS
jgi:ubiquinone biosynthesis protein COQ9